MTELKPLTDLSHLSRDTLLAMRDAGQEIRECYRVLKKGGSNVVREVIAGTETFYEWNHYPDGDVYDPETHAQYYYHAHRGTENEHGHFHTFLRKKGMPKDCRPVDHPDTSEWPEDDDALTHFVAISMDGYGYPFRLFSTNRWVTGETWYTAEDVCRMIDRFLIDHAYPSWPTNRWISAMFTLYRPEIIRLLEARDVAVAAWRESHPDGDVLEDRDLEVTAAMEISVDDAIARVEAALA
jgi:hypothetical protein